MLLDEWSVIPLELQPFLADLIRRAFCSLNTVTVKIGAIEQRSNFKYITELGYYVGMELGADISANVDLDDFMVFGNDSEKASRFFADMFHRHVNSTLKGQGLPEFPSSDSFIQKTFTQRNVFEELVRAAEGVPRDAINIGSVAAQKADDKLIGMQHIREAARVWYQRDKESSVPAAALKLLHWITDQVIGSRKARAFLLQQGHELVSPLIGQLVDLRVLHIVKKGISAKDMPGVRFNVYQLDFGCYVDLLKTDKAPLGLFEADEDGFVEVPIDDYRSIRRSILDLEEYVTQT